MTEKTEAVIEQTEAEQTQAEPTLEQKLLTDLPKELVESVSEQHGQLVIKTNIANIIKVLFFFKRQ